MSFGKVSFGKMSAHQIDMKLTMSNMFYYSDSEETTQTLISKQKLISNLISAEISPKPINYSSNITFSLGHGNYPRDKVNCSFVNQSKTNVNESRTNVSDTPFSTRGCSVVTFSGTRTNCICNHMTSFAVMTKIDGKKIPVSTFC